jgi:hypothetical protein
MALVQKVGVALREALGAPGINPLTARGPASEQSVGGMLVLHRYEGRLGANGFDSDSDSLHRAS